MMGATIILFILVSNLIGTFIKEGASTLTGPGDSCASGQNATTCFSSSQGSSHSFVSEVLDVTFLGDFGDGTPAILSAIWALTMTFLLAVAVLLIITSFIPTLGA